MFANTSDVFLILPNEINIYLFFRYFDAYLLILKNQSRYLNKYFIWLCVCQYLRCLLDTSKQNRYLNVFSNILNIFEWVAASIGEGFMLMLNIHWDRRPTLPCIRCLFRPLKLSTANSEAMAGPWMTPSSSRAPGRWPAAVRCESLCLLSFSLSTKKCKAN